MIHTLISECASTELVDQEVGLVWKTHYNPKPLPIVQSYKFCTQDCCQGELVAAYRERLDDMNQDKLVCGVSINRIQRRLLQETELTYQRAFEIAQGMKTAARDVQDLNAYTN